MASKSVSIFLLLFEFVISLARDDITDSFERAIFASNVSQLAMQNAKGVRIEFFRKPKGLLITLLESLGSRRDREHYFDFRKSLGWNIRLHVLKRT